MPDLDPNVEIHPTAIVEKGAQLGVGVTIGPYAYIGPRVVLGDYVQVDYQGCVSGYTEVGNHSRVWSFATVGSEPQDLKYKGEDTRLICGAYNKFREYCNISLGTESGGGFTRIGDHNLFMLHSHIAHDCIVGNHTILANSVAVAGHVVIDDHAIIGGNSACRQFIKIGRHALLAGGTFATQDILPYVVAQGNLAATKGINLIGLQRHDFAKDKISRVREIYKIIYRQNYTADEALQKIKEDFPDTCEIAKDFRTFLEKSTRGICR